MTKLLRNQPKYIKTLETTNQVMRVIEFPVRYKTETMDQLEPIQCLARHLRNCGSGTNSRLGLEILKLSKSKE